jgi:hypothetical protein
LQQSIDREFFQVLRASRNWRGAAETQKQIRPIARDVLHEIEGGQKSALVQSTTL